MDRQWQQEWRNVQQQEEKVNEDNEVRAAEAIATSVHSTITRKRA
jgi:hypothetical protein